MESEIHEISLSEDFTLMVLTAQQMLKTLTDIQRTLLDTVTDIYQDNPIYKIKIDRDFCVKDEENPNICKKRIVACQNEWHTLTQSQNYTLTKLYIGGCGAVDGSRRRPPSLQQRSRTPRLAPAPPA
ncbi:unnamed protein product [Euphydryas editha]|uniref:Uncharacterized protein n=1 Tax=Euphydryas editha TaxID=104508 RepID=A0AAU9V6I1_EUPED|nr:unnamed protein product [Euphydryas editha]